MVKCKECEAEISPKAKACPQCGADPRSWWGRRGIISKVVIGFWGVFFGFAIIGSMFGGSETSNAPAGAKVDEAPKVNTDQILANEMYQALVTNLGDAAKSVHVESSVMSVEIDASELTRAELEYLTRILTEAFHGQRAGSVTVHVYQRNILIAEGQYSAWDSSIDVKLKV